MWTQRSISEWKARQTENGNLVCRQTESCQRMAPINNQARKATVQFDSTSLSVFVLICSTVALKMRCVCAKKQQWNRLDDRWTRFWQRLRLQWFAPAACANLSMTTDQWANERIQEQDLHAQTTHASQACFLCLFICLLKYTRASIVLTDLKLTKM